MLELLPSGVKTVLERLHAGGYEACLVGGCVRDWLMGVAPHDFDLTTSALPQQVEDCFSDLRVIGTGLKHGTVTVIADGEPVEITTYRVDGDYTDGRRPDSVSFTPSLIEDLKRRDFTMNAVAWSPQGVTDPFGGREDIKAQLIRCVGEPDRRFTEDALRLMRALRFSATLGFSIDAATAASLRKNADRLSAVSAERILSELERLVCGKNAERVLLDFADVIAKVLPLNTADSSYAAACAHVAQLPADRTLRLAALLEPLGADGAYAALKALKADNRTCDIAAAVIGEKVVSGLAYAKRLIRRRGYAVAELVAAFRQNSALASDIFTAKAQHACVSLSDLAINGSDLIAAGFPSTHLLGKTLNFLLDRVIDGKVENERGALLALALEKMK